jgi:hypothetical protein
MFFLYSYAISLQIFSLLGCFLGGLAVLVSFGVSVVFFVFGCFYVFMLALSFLIMGCVFLYGVVLILCFFPDSPSHT